MLQCSMSSLFASSPGRLQVPRISLVKHAHFLCQRHRQGLQVTAQAAPKPGQKGKKKRYIQVRNLNKPQLQFSDRLQTQEGPWDPRFAHWPGQQTVGEWWAAAQEAILSHVPEERHLRPTDSTLQVKALKSTPWALVSTPEELAQLATALAAEPEVAVDLENHDVRSYAGFTCLLQLSTRKADFIVDALSLRSHVGPLLGPVFADGRVLKVFHSADCDNDWLQRCFGIYVCNLFDTAQAERILRPEDFPNNQAPGLKALLARYANIEIDKHYQMADWRLRPLPSPMLEYARTDTHFLLHVKDCQLVCVKHPRFHDTSSHHPLCLQAKLNSREDKATVPPATQAAPGVPASPEGSSSPQLSPAAAVLEAGRQLCLTPYTKLSVAEMVELAAERKQRELQKKKPPREMTPEVLKAWKGALTALLTWRDRVARAHDDSPGYFLPDKQLRELARDPPAELPDQLRRSLTAKLGGGDAQEIQALVQALEVARSFDRPKRPTADAEGAVLSPTG